MKIELTYLGMTLTIFYDADDGEIESVTNQKNDNYFDELCDNAKDLLIYYFDNYRKYHNYDFRMKSDPDNRMTA